ncbi:MAG TPA: spore coat protein CotJB [Candidatus Scatomorpha stercoravium]|nr:spore coat protein CotJB [Candidatus Scatomorpha stercoravium]
MPSQASSEPAYSNAEALSRGTLFPGLDLPFMNIVNKMPAKTTPLRELMALDFVCNELALYLDTHPKDAEAFKTYQAMLKLYEEGRNSYAAKYGPLQRSDMAYAPDFNWLGDPWPWDFVKEG